MIIDDAKVYRLEVPIAATVRTSFGTMNQRIALFLELRDRDGFVGWSESWVNFPAWSAAQNGCETAPSETGLKGEFMSDSVVPEAEVRMRLERTHGRSTPGTKSAIHTDCPVAMDWLAAMPVRTDHAPPR